MKSFVNTPMHVTIEEINRPESYEYDLLALSMSNVNTTV